MTRFSAFTIIAAVIGSSLAGCNNDDIVDPVVGNYSVDVFNGLSMPLSEAQVEIEPGVNCDIDRSGIASFANDLSFSVSVQNRIFNCTDPEFNKEESIVFIGTGFELEFGSRYGVQMGGSFSFRAECVLSGNLLVCQDLEQGQEFLNFQSTRIE